MIEAQEYLAQFGLREEPFAPTADPAYFYATPAHQACLRQLWHSIDARHGIVVVLGHYGAGKTTLLRKVLANMAADPERYVSAVIGSPLPTWTSFGLLEAIVAQFGLEPQEASFTAYMDALYAHLVEHRDKICTLIIDDAQNLNKRGQLELLRLVQNLETQQHKLLNLLLFAQLEWTEVLRAAPNFEQRVNMTHTLPALSLEELRECIDFRLAQGGAQSPNGPHFTDAAVAAIHAYAEGVPRMVITLCRNALLLAGEQDSLEITPDLVLRTVDQTTVPDADKRARMTAAIREANRKAVAATGGVPESSAAPRDRQDREQRAADLLLRGVPRPGGDG